MKVKILAPEVTVGDKTYAAGKTVDIKDDNERERLERWGYVSPIEEEPEGAEADSVKEATPRANKARTPENKEV